MFVVVQCVLYTLANGSNALLMHNNIIDIDKYKNNWMKLMGEVGMAVQIRALARAYTPCTLRMKLHDVVYCCGLQIVIVYNSMTLTNYCTVKKRVLYNTHLIKYGGVFIHPSAPKHPLGVYGCL